MGGDDGRAGANVRFAVCGAARRAARAFTESGWTPPVPSAHGASAALHRNGLAAVPCRRAIPLRPVPAGRWQGRQWLSGFTGMGTSWWPRYGRRSPTAACVEASWPAAASSQKIATAPRPATHGKRGETVGVDGVLGLAAHPRAREARRRRHRVAHRLDVLAEVAGRPGCRRHWSTSTAQAPRSAKPPGVRAATERRRNPSLPSRPSDIAWLLNLRGVATANLPRPPVDRGSSADRSSATPRRCGARRAAGARRRASSLPRRRRARASRRCRPTRCGSTSVTLGLRPSRPARRGNPSTPLKSRKSATRRARARRDGGRRRCASSCVVRGGAGRSEARATDHRANDRRAHQRRTRRRPVSPASASVPSPPSTRTARCRTHRATPPACGDRRRRAAADSGARAYRGGTTTSPVWLIGGRASQRSTTRWC